MATATVEQIRRVVTQYESRGADKAAADLNAVAAAQGNVARTGESMATVTDTVTKRQLSASNAADTVRRKYDEEFRTIQTLAREHQRLDRALQQGAITAQEYARTLDLMHAKHRVFSAAQQEMTRRVEEEDTSDGGRGGQQRYATHCSAFATTSAMEQRADVAAFGGRSSVSVRSMFRSPRSSAATGKRSTRSTTRPAKAF